MSKTRILCQCGFPQAHCQCKAGSPDNPQASPVLVPKEFLSCPPGKIKRPCDYGLELAVSNLVSQLGTIEAFNRLTNAAWLLREEIEEGRIKEPIPGAAEPAKE